MKYKTIFSVAVLSMCFASMTLGQTTTVLTVVADTDIRNQANVDYAKANRTETYLCNHSSPTGISGKAYLRFQIPKNVLVTSATLKFVTKQVTAATTDISVSGLNDGVPFENWAELSPGAWTGNPSGGLTWNNAPGNLKTSNYQFDPNTTVVLGVFQMGADAVGTVHTFSSQALVDYLNADTNGLVNFLLGKVSATSAWSGIATKENTSSLAAPQLEITYIERVYMRADINKDSYVNFKDVAKLAQNWMQCSVPGDPGCI